MNELALFAGAGGGLLASHILGWRTRCAVEIDAYARKDRPRRKAQPTPQGPASRNVARRYHFHLTRLADGVIIRT
jgi:site-specific DNA-cytosine methylase